MSQVDEIAVGKLGLAAYIKMKQGGLLRYTNGNFFFRSGKSLHDWEIEYANSCCARHDSEVCELRKFLRTSG